MRTFPQTTHLALLAGATFFAGQANAVDLITNGGFESDNTGWTGAGAVYNHPYNGIAGIKLAGADGAQATADTGNFDFNTLRYGFNNDVAHNIGAKFHGLSGGSQTIGKAALEAAVPVSDIDSGRGVFSFSAWLASYVLDENTPAIRVRFFGGENGDGTLLGTQTLDRGTTVNQVETAQHLATADYLNGADDSRTDSDYWALYKIASGIPAGTRSAIVDIVAGTGHVAAGSNDWYVEAVVLDVVSLPVLHWTGLASSEWSLAGIAAPKNWESSAAPGVGIDFTLSAPVLFDDLSGAGNVVLSGGDVEPASVTVSNSGARPFTFSGAGAIKGGSGLSKSGTGTLSLLNANTFTGVTNITGGSLVLENVLALQNSTVITHAGQGSLQFGAPVSYTVAGLSGNGSVSLLNNASQGVVLTVGNGNGSSSFEGSFSGAGGLVKVGSGTLTLVSSSPLASDTALNGGWVEMLNKDALGTGALVSAGGGLMFNFGNGTNTEIPNPVTLPTTGRPMFVIGGNPTALTKVTLNGKVTGGAADQVYRFVDTNVGGNHNSVVALTNPANDFQGIIEMWRGHLIFTSDAVLGNPGNDIRHYTEGTGSLQFGADNITLNPGRDIQFLANTNPTPIDTQGFTGTIAGNFSGVGNLIKVGSGTLVLTGTNNATGPTVVRAGTLELDGTFATGELVTVEAAGKLSGTGNVGRSVTVQGTLSPGNGVGRLSTTGVLTLAEGSKYDVQISNWGGSAGTGFDQITADSIVVTATPAVPATVVVTPSNLINFASRNTRFVIAAGVNAGTSFDPAAFVVDATAMPPSEGTWSVRLEGNDLVLALTVTSSAPFLNWIADKGLAGDDAAMDADPDQDGVPNGIEFVIGGEPNPANPNSNSCALLPSPSIEGGFFVFTFRRTAASAAMVPVVEYQAGLSGEWSEAEDGVEGVTIQAAPGEPDVEIIRVRIPITGSLQSKCFARLMLPG